MRAVENVVGVQRMEQNLFGFGLAGQSVCRASSWSRISSKRKAAVPIEAVGGVTAALL